MALGTAPHRVSPGIWATRNGRVLSAAGSAYWEHHFRTGLVSEAGHITMPSVVQRGPTAANLVTLPPGANQQPKPSASDYKLVQSAFQGRADRNDPLVRAASARIRAHHTSGLLTAGRVAAHVAAQPVVGLGHFLQGVGIGLSASARGTSAGTTRAQAVHELVPHAATQLSNVAIGPALTARLQGRKASGLGVGLDLALLP